MAICGHATTVVMTAVLVQRIKCVVLLMSHRLCYASNEMLSMTAKLRKGALEKVETLLSDLPRHMVKLPRTC